MPMFGPYSLQGDSKWEPGDEGGMQFIYDTRGKVVGIAVSENPFDNKEHNRAQLFVAAPDLFELAKSIASAQFSFEIEAFQVKADEILEKIKEGCN